MVDDSNIASDSSLTSYKALPYSNVYEFQMRVHGVASPFTFVMFENPSDAQKVPSVASVMAQLMKGIDESSFLNKALQEKKDTEGYRLSAILDTNGKAVAVAGTRMQYGASGSKVSMLDLQHFVVDEKHRNLGFGTKLLGLTKRYYVDHLGQKPNSGINVTLSMDSLNRNEGANKKIYMQLGAVTDMIRAHIPTNKDGKLTTDFTDQEQIKLFDKQYSGAQKQIRLWQELANIAKSNKDALIQKINM